MSVCMSVAFVTACLGLTALSHDALHSAIHFQYVAYRCLKYLILHVVYALILYLSLSTGSDGDFWGRC